MRQTPNTDWQMGAVVFIDVVGSTELMLGGRRSGSDLLIGYMGVATKLARQLGALAVRATGDGVMAVFGSPTDAAAFASRAASKAAALARRRGRAEPFRVRIGISTGELAVRPEAVGVPVNVAARLASLAEPSTILCDEATWALAHRLPGRWRSTTTRPRLPGLPAVMPVYESSLANGRGHGTGDALPARKRHAAAPAP